MADAVVVLLGSSGRTSAAVRDVLRDWVCLGIVQPFLWVDGPTLSPDGPLGEVPATLVAADDARRVLLQNHLADQQSIGILRLVALRPAGTSVDLLERRAGKHLLDELGARLPNRVAGLQVLLARHGCATPEDLDHHGWHTLVLAPEDAWNPRSAATELLESSSEDEVVAHAAAGVAAAAGLWVGMGRGPFDAVKGANSVRPEVFRCFLRHLDASAVSQALRSRLTDVSQGLPRPREAAGRMEYLLAPEEAAAQVATAVQTAHAHLFAVPKAALLAEPPTATGAWAAINAFLRFLAASLSRAPGEFADRMTARGAAGIARTVQSALYGGESRYEVIVRGINADGRPAGMYDLDADASVVAERVQAALPSSQQVVPDARAFWQDAIGGALTLADAGERSVDVPPVTAGGRAGVVRDVAVIVPSPDDTFTLPRAAAARFGQLTVSPYDVHGQHAAAEALRTGAEDDPESETAVRDFASWRRRVLRTYGGFLGTRLADEVEQHRRTLGAHLKQLANPLDRAGADDELLREQSAVQRLLRSLIGGAALVIGAAVAVDLLDTLTQRTGWSTAVLLLLVLVTIAFFLIARHQRNVFRLVHARVQVDRELELAGRNLAAVSAALQRSIQMYGQYLAWTPVLARFLREPFGPPASPTSTPVLEGLLPRAIGFGTAEPDAESIDHVAEELSGVVFERGWLSDLWQSLIEEAPDRLGHAGLELRDDPQALLADRARSIGSALVEWSLIVQTEGPGQAGGDVHWQGAQEALEALPVEQLFATLFSRVRVQAQGGHGVTGTQPGKAFFSTLTDSLEDVSHDRFASGLFTDLARTQHLNQVQTTTVIGAEGLARFGHGQAPAGVLRIEPAPRTALDQFVVVVQTSAAVPPSALNLGASRPIDEQPTRSRHVERAGLAG